MRIAYLYRFKAFPPAGGNHLHAYQLIRRFLAVGHEVLTFGDASVPGVRSFPRNTQGFADLMATAEIVYLRIDGNTLGTDEVLVAGLQRSDLPMVWEINAPANEALAFSWLGGRQVSPSRPVLKALDQAKRSTHAARLMLKVIPEERLRRRLAKKVSGATCVSQALERYAKEGLGIRKTLVLPNGSDPELNRPERAAVGLPERFSDHLKVLYAGSPIYPWQGLDVIMKTIRLQRHRTVPIAFLLLLNQVTSNIPAGDNVHVLHAVAYDEVAGYINAADVCLAIHPEYHWSRWGFHGSPMKLFDYMACGRAVVTSRVGQMKSVIRDGENGLLCENTPEDLLSKLEYLAARPDLRASMGATARRDVLERYNWESIADRTLGLFESVVRS